MTTPDEAKRESAATERIAEALVVCLTRGVGLLQWKEAGILEREWALYQALLPQYSQIVFVTDGGEKDEAIARQLGERVSVIAAGGADEQSLLSRVCRSVASGRGAVVKSNQFHGASRAVAVARALRSCGVRTGLVVRGGYLHSAFVAIESGADSLEAREAGEEESRALVAADVVVGTTAEMIDSVCWRYAIARHRTAVIPNYVPAIEADDASRNRDEGFVLCAGRFAAQKRIELVIRACARLKSLHKLVVVGNGPLEAELRTLAKSLEVHVEFQNRMPHRELRRLMSRCAVFVQASAYEGHPKTVLEAMAAGAPVVVTRSPGLANDVRHRETGLVADSDPECIAGAIEELLSNKAAAKSLGASAQQWIRQNRSLETIVPLELEAHRRAMGCAGSGGQSGDHAVRWSPELLEAESKEICASWEASIRGFARRLTARNRAHFLAALDRPIYEMQGEAAAEADGGLHPKHRLMAYHDFFVERIGRGERVIDLGCGVGALAHSIAMRSGAYVIGIDLSAKNLDRARQTARSNTSVRFELGDITTTRLQEQFEVVVLSNVLEHLADRPKLLRQWRQWYGAQRFLIRVPAFDREWRVPWKRELGVEWRLDPTHETEYTLEQLEQEVREAGLEIVEAVSRWGEYWIEARAGVQGVSLAVEQSAA